MTPTPYYDDPGNRRVLELYPAGTAVIWYRELGKVKTLAVGADARRDDESTLTAHLCKWKPSAEFITSVIG